MVEARTSVVGASCLVALTGVADLSGVPSMHTALRRATSHRVSRLTVDLDGLSVLDDAAIGLLLGAAHRMRDRDGSLAIVATVPAIRHRLTAMRVDEILDVFDSVAAATGGLTESPAAG